MYPTSKKLKSKAFKLNSENIKQVIGIQLTFILETELQKEDFFEKYGHFFSQ